MKESDRIRTAQAESVNLASGSSVERHASAARLNVVGRRTRSALIGAAMLGVVALGISRQGGGPRPSVVGIAPEWDIELSSSGDEPAQALVFGREAGVHLVSIPAAGAPAGERRRIAARLARGDVYLVSVGGAGLQVGTNGPPGTGVVAMSARARFVKLYQRPDATGIRTGWW